MALHPFAPVCALALPAWTKALLINPRACSQDNEANPTVTRTSADARPIGADCPRTLLRRHLARPSPDRRDHSCRGSEAHPVGESGGDTPTDRAGLELDSAATACGQAHPCAVEPRVAGLDQARGVLAEG